jgi:2-keto-3-deoxy-L-rhamnonate aldolase RhmA
MKEKLRSGSAVFGCAVVGTGYPEIAHAYAQAGFDFVLIENEHFPLSLESDQQLIRACRAADIPVIVRVPDAEYHLVARTLDAGAEGVIVPRIQGPQQAADVVSWVKYPPQGRRGYGAGPLLFDYQNVPIADAISHLNDNTVVIVQAETMPAIETAQGIAAVQGLDAVMIGPADLSISLGIPGEFRSPKFVEQVERVAKACAQAGIASGIFCGDLDLLKSYIAMGMRCFSCGGEIGLIRKAATDLVQSLHSLLPKS